MLVFLSLDRRSRRIGLTSGSMGVVLDILALLEEGVLAGLRGSGARKTTLGRSPELPGGAEAETLGNHGR